MAVIGQLRFPTSDATSKEISARLRAVAERLREELGVAGVAVVVAMRDDAREISYSNAAMAWPDDIHPTWREVWEDMLVHEDRYPI